jgi:glutamate racemase
MGNKEIGNKEIGNKEIGNKEIGNKEIAKGKAIGIFDSGVGGLSVLRHIRARMPNEDLIYLADQVNVPYGPRPQGEIRRFCRAITRFFLAEQVQLIVVACNTASGVALTHLRRTFPQVLFVGMEPAVKPAAQQTKSGKVGVLATEGTLESQRYAALMARYGHGSAREVEFIEDPCPGLVQLIESGATESPVTKALLEQCLAPMLTAGVDTVVLGCTHYPLVLPLIQHIVKGAASIIDPAPAVARQTERLLHQAGSYSPADNDGEIVAYTTGDPNRFSHLTKKLMGQEFLVRQAAWQEGHVLAA